MASARGPWAAVRPYFEKEALAAFFVGISSGFPYAMIGATLTTRLAQDGIDKKTVTAFTLAFLAYNLKVLWAWVVDGVRIPLLGRLGQRVSWLLLAGAAVIAAVMNLALVDPAASIEATVIAAVPTVSRRSSRTSLASGRGCRSMAGGSAPPLQAQWHWSSRAAGDGRRPTSCARRLRSRRC